jgi:hypothetical protein
MQPHQLAIWCCLGLLTSQSDSPVFSGIGQQDDKLVKHLGAALKCPAWQPGRWRLRLLGVATGPRRCRCHTLVGRSSGENDCWMVRPARPRGASRRATGQPYEADRGDEGLPPHRPVGPQKHARIGQAFRCLHSTPQWSHGLGRNPDASTAVQVVVIRLRSHLDKQSSARSSGPQPSRSFAIMKWHVTGSMS